MGTRTKADWRQHSLRLRDALPESDHAEKSRKICTALIALPVVQELQSRNERPILLAYWPLRSEVDVRPFVQWAWGHGWTVAVPRVELATAQMQFHIVKGIGDLQPGAFGILEPSHSAPRLKDSASAELILMPGAAFDTSGCRIGYGGGYYDRFLQRIDASVAARETRNRTGLIRLAPAFDLQVQDALPAEVHDYPVHMILTESRLLTVSC